MSTVPDIRIRTLNDREVARGGEWVLYWMVAYRRTHSNFSLQRAVEWAERLKKPLLVFEPLTVGYAHASDRLHRFVIDGMCDNEESLRECNALYYPYIEPRKRAGRGLIEALAARACVVVSDDWPSFFVPKLQQAKAHRFPVRFEVVDGNGLLPLRATQRVFSTAASFRIFLRKNLEPHLKEVPLENPLRREYFPPLPRLPREIEERWPNAARRLLDGDPEALRALPIDHSVPPTKLRGGQVAAMKRLRLFVRERLQDYEVRRDSPQIDGTSKLSPYLHFGHLCTAQIFRELARHERKSEGARLEPSRSLFGFSHQAEAFLDELVTWREVGFNMSSKREDAAEYESLPDWAKRTLDAHRSDPRPKLQSRMALEHGTTPDPVYNAAQRQLLSEGWFHNVMRMIWGKKILEYSASPEAALQTIMELMNRYSLDGRDPNSISGAFWVFGRYDRPWGPERKIFGKVRYMTSDTSQKLRRYSDYLDLYSAPAAP